MIYAELDMMDYIQGRTMGVAALRLPSENLFSFALNVDEVFGVPVSASSGGLAMDVDRNIKAMKALDGDMAKKVRFALASGMNSSALEHSVPEQLFSTAENPAQGISAVKALQLANDQGKPIYTINQTNIDSVLPQLQVDPEVIVDIQNAVNAGKEVTVSKANISFNGWNGCGYIVINPATGAGAYMISGGMAGGWILFWAVYTDLLQYEIDYLVCVKNKIFFGPDDNANFLFISGLFADMAVAAQFLATAKVGTPFVYVGGAGTAYILGFAALTSIMFSIGWSCKNQ